MEPKIFINDHMEILNLSRTAVKSRLKTKNIQGKYFGNKIYTNHDDGRIIFGEPKINKVVSIHAAKGGVGKSTLAFSISSCAALFGFKILAIDLDMQGNLSRAFGKLASDNKIFLDILKKECTVKDAIKNVCPGIDLIPSSIRSAKLARYLLTEGKRVDKAYSKIINPLKEDYDLIIIDLPPSIDLSVCAALLASDEAICPVTTDSFSKDGLDLTYAEFKDLMEDYKSDVSFKILLNNIDQRTLIADKISNQIMGDKVYHSMIYPSFIRSSIEFKNCIEKGESIFEKSKKTTAKSDIIDVTKQIIEFN
jgi:chromosome partitioning protein